MACACCRSQKKYPEQKEETKQEPLQVSNQIQQEKSDNQSKKNQITIEIESDKPANPPSPEKNQKVPEMNPKNQQASPKIEIQEQPAKPSPKPIQPVNEKPKEEIKPVIKEEPKQEKPIEVPKPQPQPEKKPEPQPKKEAQDEKKPEKQPEKQPEPQPKKEIEPEKKPHSQPQPEPEPKPEIKEQPKVEIKLDIEVKNEMKEESKIIEVDIVAQKIKPKFEQIVIRKEIRSMSEQEQNRFFDAIDRMCINKNDQPGTSEYFRLAQYHGGPGQSYCSHGVETFPGWHRIYLKEFEYALREADIQNGNDGNIFLPYWDWTSNVQDGLPSIIRKRFAQFPKDLFPKDVVKIPKLTRATDERISKNIQSYKVLDQAYDCLNATQHWVFASTGNEWASPYPSIETSHNSIHGIVGGSNGPMGSIAWAAFDVIFWLHHCNVDRIYESYLKLESDSQIEFSSYESKQEENLYEKEFAPFDTKPVDNKLTQYYKPQDTFNTIDLSYKYDQLLQPKPLKLMEPPTLCVFPQIVITTLNAKCYQLHVFVVDKDKENEFKGPSTDDELAQMEEKSEHYAGAAMIFGRGSWCETCQKREPFDIVVDITSILRNLKISRYNAKLKVYCLDTTIDSNELIPIEQTPVPKPIITGPLFENKNEMLTLEKRNDNNSFEVRALQQYLKKYGYYDDEIDGDYGPITEQAVKDYQQAKGSLKIDGLAGPKTKTAMTSEKRCNNIDPFAKNKVEDPFSKNEKHYHEQLITYFIDTCPGYLNRNDVIQVIFRAFQIWGNVCGLEFQLIDNKDKADIKLIWTYGDDNDNYGNLLHFDGPGGTLAVGGKGFINYDISERWTLGININNQNEIEISNDLSDLNDTNTWRRGEPQISLFYTTLHELGHCLGLNHSMDPNDLMSPFYNPKISNLSLNDKKRIIAIYGVDQQYEEQEQQQQDDMVVVEHEDVV